MQIVLSNNRVLAYGDNCFIAMGGTVVCEDTGKVYQNATIAECDCVPADIDAVGYEYHAGEFKPCAPYGKTDSGYIMVSCDECGTPKQTPVRVEDGAVSIAGGGTGATTAAGARANLGVTPANIGAFATYPQKTVTDANTVYDAGLYLISGGVNTPTQYGTLVVLPYRNVTGNTKTDYCAQLFLPTGDHPDTGIFYRTSKADTWNEWNKLIGRVLDSKMYGDTLPADAKEKGRLFFLKA